MYGSNGSKPKKFLPKFEELKDTLENVFNSIAKRTGKPETPVGLAPVDEGTFGIQKGHLITVSARPAIGKTSWACQIALQAARRGKSTCIISLEMTRELLVERLFCISEHINGFDLLTGKIDTIIQSKFVAFRKELETLPLLIVDDYGYTVEELYNLVEGELEFKPDIFILDHLQHIRTDRQKDREAIDNYLIYLKQLAKRFGQTIIVLSQINREGAEKPTLGNMKSSGKIEEISDAVFIISRKKTDHEACNNINVELAKNRYGPVGDFQMYFHGPFMKFFNGYQDYSVECGVVPNTKEEKARYGD